MKTRPKFLCGKSAVACLALALLVGSAFAGKFTITATSDLFPGVDADGNIDLMNTGGGLLSLTINTKNGKSRVKGGAIVPNESGAKQTYKNDPALAEALFGPMPPEGVEIKKTSYKVTAEGNASLNASVVIPLDLL